MKSVKWTLLLLVSIFCLSIGYSALNTDLSISGEATLKKGIVYTEKILNGTDPVLEEPLIPVTIENDGTVRKASIYEEWYKYENSEWANAVILKDDSLIYQVGNIIPENNIESYFVWIPRFKYKIFDEGLYSSRTEVENAVETINVIFENKNTVASKGTKVGEWLTHPAFISFNSNGFWVGKFETGTTLTSNFNVRNGNAILIKPNISSWRNIQVANAFYSSYDYQRSLDSHLIKNTEWGAMAYLQHSIYGSKQSVRINNNSNFITGYAANVEPTCGYTTTNESCNIYCRDGSCNSPYNTSVGFLESTTGNISGVYDTSGGSWEYVMGVMRDDANNLITGQNESANSGFNGIYGENGSSLISGYEWPAQKYYDVYSYAITNNQYQNRILGDATGELGPFNFKYYTTSSGFTANRSIGSWYEDDGYFVYNLSPWFLRSSIYDEGLNAGIFSFSITTGKASNVMGFRVVLTPN